MNYLIQSDQGYFLKCLEPEIWTVNRPDAWIMTMEEVLQTIGYFDQYEPDLAWRLEILESAPSPAILAHLDAIDVALENIDTDLAEVEAAYIEQSSQLRSFNGDLSELM